MAGGEGTELRPLTYDIPKGLVRLHERTLIEHILDLFKKNGITEIYIAIGYLGGKIVDYLGDGSRFGVKIKYYSEMNPLGTAGCIRNIKKELTEAFFVVNGSNIMDINLCKMQELHNKNNATVTMAVRQTEDEPRNWAVELQGNRIVKLIEKPKKEDHNSNFINSGLYLFSAGALEMIKPGFSMLEKDLFPRLAEQGRLYGYRFDGQWFDIGDFARLENAEKRWKDIR